MAIKDYVPPLASDPETKQRALAVIEREFQTRFIGDSEEAARRYLSTIGIAPSDSDIQIAIEKRDRARYDELKDFNPFEAARFAQRNPHIHRHGENRVNTALNMAQNPHGRGPQPALAERMDRATKSVGGAK